MMINQNDPLDVQVEKQAKIIAALMKRAERQQDVGAGAFEAFQSAWELKKKVVDQSRDLERAAHDLESAHYERERIRRALTGALSSMQESFALFSDGQLDVFNDQLGKVLPDISDRLQIGLSLDAFFDCLWTSQRFASCDRSLTEIKAKAIGTLRVETTLSALIELKGDFWYQLNIQHVAPDSLVLLLTQITDLVRRNRAEKDSLIDRQADYLQAVFQNISSGLCTFSADDTVMMYNERFRAAIGLPDHLLSAPLQMRSVVAHLLDTGILRPDQAAEVEVWRLELRQKGRLERRVRFGDDQFFDVHANMLPDGGYVIELKDVTLEARNQELLENRVMERTAELTRANEQLVQEYDEKARVEEELRLAKERAEAAVSSKTRFLAAASHDLLQPINAAKLLISTLRLTTENTVHAPMVKRLDGAFGSAEQLLHSLVDLSRLESPESDAVSLSEVALAPLLEGVHADQILVAQQKGVELDMVPCSAIVRSDPVYLLRSVQNLVVNAIQYTQPGGRVLFGCRRVGNSIILEVWDTGVGIARKDQKRIFDEFARAGDAQTIMGLGLGLSIVDRACRLLDHKLKVRSAPGRGSVFSIEMNIVARVQEAKDLKVDVAPFPTASLDYIFLVIENEPAVLDSMTLWLEHRGGSVLPARTVEQAIALAREIGMPPDAILADYQLDGSETGVDAIQQIRAHYQTPTPAVLITANRNKSLWREVVEYDISVLAKPVKLAPLHALVERKIKRFREAQRVQATMQTKVEGDA